MSDPTPYPYYPDNGQGPSGNSWPNNGTTPYPNDGSQPYLPPQPSTMYAPPGSYGQQPYYPPQGAQQMYQQPQPVYMPYGGYSTGQTNGPGIASMVLGIIGVITFWFPFVGLPVSIVGLALAAAGMRRIDGKGFAVAGLVLTIIGVVLSGCIAAATLSALFRFYHY